ncbi:MAG: L,D-transpeptidase family protein [Candidatus Pacebacteria bacterium]|nr:L,D-transpeptidase family protein [Candidatus Paceibacterota bacterium]
MIDESKKRRFYAVRHEDDIPQDGKGVLIPRISHINNRAETRGDSSFNFLALLPVLGIVMLFGLGVFGVQTVSSMNTASVPQISIVNSYTSQIEPLNYGVQVSLREPSFFTETRDAFIDSELSFIEVDLVAMKLRNFTNGILVESMPIISKGQNGSWCQTQAGLYKIETKKEKHFSAIGQVYQPWSLSFQSNFYIHGWSLYADEKPVSEDFAGDCIRLNIDDAERLFKEVKVGTPILVHEADVSTEPFLYEPKVPDLKTPHYLIADVDSSTVLASSDLDAPAPIASITKLMTAVIATEYISLDRNVAVSQPTFVQSLVPRLGDRSQVSMYSLLQLLLVESSNEAAEVIASELGRDKFMALMNQKAVDIGMTDTYFIDPSGLGAENVSSVSDLLRLTQYIHKNRNFIFELTVNQYIPTSYVSGEFGDLLNFNEVKGLDNFIGGKVGETKAAGQTSISLHNLEVKGKLRTIAVIILGSEDRNHDVTELLHYAEKHFGN